MRVFVITGISRGLGEKIAQELINNKETVIGIGRNFTEQQKEDSRMNPDQFQVLNCDLSDISDVTNLIAKLERILSGKFNEIIFINNAGIIEPIKKIGEFSNNVDIYNHININYVSPSIIINSLVKLIENNMKLKILNITSGAAERPIEGWSLYCSTKKATKMFLDVLNEENNKVVIKHIDPGVMNTEMQHSIRNSHEGDFPTVNQFRNYKETGRLLEPSDVAVKVLEGYID